MRLRWPSARSGPAAPNPAVGCVIVSPDGRIVGRGCTQRGGRPHAETVALEAAGEAARGATAYVTLEPCSHHGQTPPCADALVEAGVARVVAAVEDPDPRVSGRALPGCAMPASPSPSASARQEAAELNRRLLQADPAGRPLVTLKIAQSIDGKTRRVAIRRKQMDHRARRRGAYGHLLRARHDAILIGIGTALADDPELTCRLPGLEDALAAARRAGYAA